MRKSALVLIVITVIVIMGAEAGAAVTWIHDRQQTPVQAACQQLARQAALTGATYDACVLCEDSNGSYTEQSGMSTPLNWVCTER